jgi:hypothetical protein
LKGSYGFYPCFCLYALLHCTSLHPWNPRGW